MGGGALGCSVLYHLVKLGWQDVALVERAELTSGSTWHAAGNTPHYSTSMLLSRVHQYSNTLYQQLEAETGQPVGFHKCGSLRLANVPDRMDEYRYHRAKARYIGLPFEIVGPDEIRQIHPLLNTEGLYGAAWTPDDGYIDPTMMTNALAQGARNGGAHVARHTRVTNVSRTPSGEWQVKTDRGTIVAENVVNAAGTWAREIGFFSGLDLPIVPVEHQYVVFDTVPELAALGREVPIVREVDVSYYMRQEGHALLVGPYERALARTFAPYGVPPAFGADLLPPELTRLQPILEGAMFRCPPLEDVGIRRVVNGPITYTPDGNALLGPAPGLRNHWLACGFSFGIVQAGGCGKLLAEWIVQGHPEFDCVELDPRRYGDYATLPYAIERCIDTYQNEYVIYYPYFELDAGRPARTSPLYSTLKARGAFLNTRNGWERASWFAPEPPANGERVEEQYSFRRSNAFPSIAREVERVRTRAGVLDMTSFSKYMVRGRDASALLDRLVANRLPARDGGIALCHALDDAGGVVAEMTVTRLAADRYFVVSAAAAERRDLDLLRQSVRPGEDAEIENVTAAWGALSLAGPCARDILARVTRAPLDNAAFPWRTAHWMEVGPARVLGLRLSYAGELGWELFHPIELQLALYGRLMEAGADLGIGDYGLRALDSMRLEKGYRAWGSELLTEVNLLEAGLDRFVALDKGEFRGRTALLEQRARGLAHRIGMLAVDANEADCRGNEPVFRDGRLCGITTSGGYGHTLGTSLALTYLDIADAGIGTELRVEILGELRPARVIPDSPYDPENRRPRS
jgi:dimethylglycine dehydrogenase